MSSTPTATLPAKQPATWKAAFRCRKWHAKDKDQLEYRIEYCDPGLRSFRSRVSPVLRGMEEANRFWAWLLAKKPYADCEAFYGRADYFRPRLVELDTADDQVDVLGNLLMYGGVSCLWEALIGNGTTTAGQALTYFNAAQAAVGVGDSTTAAAATQTDLQASSNKLRVAMDSTYPQHTDATTSGAATIKWQSTFGNSQANYAWQEVATFNSATGGTGRMLHRLVSSFGTKASGSWSMQVSVTIS